jgi:uncharacterized protein (DUF433 family)
MARRASKVVFSHITKNPRVCGGEACIDATRIRVLDIVQAQSEGCSPEDIQKLFAVPLTLAQVYSALAYADENRSEIDALYAEYKAFSEQIEREREEYLKKKPVGPGRLEPPTIRGAIKKDDREATAVANSP